MEYQDKSRFEIYEPEIVVHRDKPVKSVISSRRFNEFYANLGNKDYKVAVLSNIMVGRPDIISQAAYGTPAYWWLIMLANDVVDAEEDLTAGKEIKIPVL